jgi:hypothetical protein
MKPGGYLGRIRFNLQFQNLCDRSEDGLASVVTFFSILVSQTACFSGQSEDLTLFEIIIGLLSPLALSFHFSISSSKGKRVNNS